MSEWSSHSQFIIQKLRALLTMTLLLSITRISHRSFVRIPLLNCRQRPYVSIVVFSELLPVKFLVFYFESAYSKADAERGSLFEEAGHLADDFLEYQFDARWVSATHVSNRGVV